MKNGGRVFNVNCIRETLGYSARLEEKIICVVIDAEPFEYYDYTQMTQDFLLLKQSCDVKIVVVIGCFPIRAGQKRNSNLKCISYVSSELEKNFKEAGMQIAVIKESEQSLETPLMRMLDERSIVMVKSEIHQADSSDIWSTLSSVSNSLNPDKISKLIIISNHDGIFGSHKKFLAQIHYEEIKGLIGEGIITGELAFIAKTAIYVIEGLGIKRVHLVNGTKSDSLFVELFTKDGSGTMIYSGEYIEIRQAVPNDAGGMHALMPCYSESDIISHFQLKNIKEFFVAAIDDYIVACARLQFAPEKGISLITSLAVNPAYVEIGRKLLEEAVNVSISQNSSILFLVIHGVAPWWMPADFKDCDIKQAPEELQKEYADKKSVTLLAKKLS